LIVIWSAFALFISFTYYARSVAPTTLYSSGAVRDVPSEGYREFGFNVTTSATLSGAYSSNASVQFYIMTRDQYVKYQSLAFGKVLYGIGSTLNVPAGNYFRKQVNVSQSGMLSGSFSASVPVWFYLLSPSEFNALHFSSLYPPVASTYSAGPGTNVSVSGRVPAGTFYAVFYPASNDAATIEVAQPIQVEYSLSSSDYVYSNSGKTGNFSMPLSPTKYYLIWVNLGNSVARLTMTENVQVHGNVQATGS
jgi:hypothetical protein